MRAIVAKKLRQYSKRNWIEYVKALRQESLKTRLRFCWYILKPKRDKEKGGKNG